MGTGDILLGGNPAMDQYPVQGGVAILLGMLRATETGISSGRVGLWLVCALPLEGGSNRDCGVEVTKTNEMASQGANICPSFISLSLSERPPKKTLLESVMRYAKELAFSSPEPFVSLGHVVLTWDENE